MTTSPADADNEQSASDEKSGDQSDLGISDSQLPEDLQPGPDNPLASPDEDIADGDESDDDDAVPEGEAPPGEPSIG